MSGHPSWEAHSSGRSFPRTWEAWALIEQFPGMSIQELAERMGLVKSAAYAHVLRLRSWGVLPDPEQGGKGRILYARVPYRFQSYLTDEERYGDDLAHGG